MQSGRRFVGTSAVDCFALFLFDMVEMKCYFKDSQPLTSSFFTLFIFIKVWYLLQYYYKKSHVSVPRAGKLE